MSTALETFASLESKPSASESRGLALIPSSVKNIFSPGISTGGVAEIKMVRQNPEAHVTATTIDEAGVKLATEIVSELGLASQIEIKLEDLREPLPYDDNSFDFIYARLVLHYLSSQDLDKVLGEFYRVLKPDSLVFVVVRSVKNMLDRSDVTYDDATKLSTYPDYDDQGRVERNNTRYFHTPVSIVEHLTKAGFETLQPQEYQEQLYSGFARERKSPKLDHVIEVTAMKPQA